MLRDYDDGIVSTLMDWLRLGDEVPEPKHPLVHLPVRLGGLGLPAAHLTAAPAYVGSWALVGEKVSALLQAGGFIDTVEELVDAVRPLQRAWDKVTADVGNSGDGVPLQGVDGELDGMEDAAGREAPLDVPRLLSKPWQGVQRILAARLANAQLASYQASPEREFGEKVRFVSGSQPFAGAWLNACPKPDRRLPVSKSQGNNVAAQHAQGPGSKSVSTLAMSDVEFRLAMLMRMQAPIARLLHTADGAVECGMCHELVPEGTHERHVICCGTKFTARHDAVVTAIASEIRRAGGKVIVAQNATLRPPRGKTPAVVTGGGSNEEARTAKRAALQVNRYYPKKAHAGTKQGLSADIIVSRGAGARPLLIDAVIPTPPLEPKASTAANNAYTTQVGTAARKAEVKKQNKYTTAHELTHDDLVVFSVEAFGAWGEQAVDYVKALASDATGKAPGTQQHNDWLRLAVARISVALQRQNAMKMKWTAQRLGGRDAACQPYIGTSATAQAGAGAGGAT